MTRWIRPAKQGPPTAYTIVHLSAYTSVLHITDHCVCCIACRRMATKMRKNQNANGWNRTRKLTPQGNPRRRVRCLMKMIYLVMVVKILGWRLHCACKIKRNTWDECPAFAVDTERKPGRQATGPVLAPYSLHQDNSS